MQGMVQSSPCNPEKSESAKEIWHAGNSQFGTGRLSLSEQWAVLWVDCWVFSTWAVTAASHDYDAISALIDLEERDKFLAFIQQEVGKLQKQTS